VIHSPDDFKDNSFLRKRGKKDGYIKQGRRGRAMDEGPGMSSRLRTRAIWEHRR